MGKTREVAVERNHQQPGGPKKLTQVLIQLANPPEPPARLPLGTDTLARLAYKQGEVERETVKWRALSASTDFVEAAKTTRA